MYPFAQIAPVLSGITYRGSCITILFPLLEVLIYVVLLPVASETVLACHIRHKGLCNMSCTSR